MIVKSWKAVTTALLIVCAIAGPVAARQIEQSPQPAPAGGDAGTAPHHDLIQGAHVEGHIAFLKAELGITPAQENLWNAVATAMREDVNNLTDTEDKLARQMHGPETAVQYLKNRVIFARLRADGEARFVMALQPLYETFSSQQKQIADDLLIPDDQK